MEKVFHFDSPREKYHSDAAVVWCFDDRFHLGFAKFLKRLGIRNPDIIKVAGGAKCLASPDLERDRDFVLEQIRLSIRLHSTSRVILMLHSDCGAYGGLAGFGGNAKAEAEHQDAELKLAAESLRAAIAGLDILAYFVDFEGVWSVDVNVPTAPLAGGQSSVVTPLSTGENIEAQGREDELVKLLGEIKRRVPKK